MRVAVVQHDVVWEDRDATLAALRPQVAAAVAGGARLVVLAEMFAVGFSMNVEHTAEAEDGPTVAWMRAIAAEHDVWVTGSVPMHPRADAADRVRPTNALILAGPSGEHLRYDKLHPFSYAGEDEVFQPGTTPAVTTVDGVRIGLSVCYDLRFANLYWHRAAEVDAEVIVASWPGARRAHWRALLDARAIENQVYVVASNRVGEGGGLSYTGDSRVVDPMGEVVASAAHQQTLLFADVDPAVVRDVRARFPFALDRRTDLGPA